jgi:hypothetical protein
MPNSLMPGAKDAMPEAGLRVECYAGYRADERPLRIWLRGKCVAVETVEDRWYSPGVTFFRVLVTGGDRYLLKHYEAQETWKLEGFRAGRWRICGIDTKITGGV